MNLKKQILITLLLSISIFVFADPPKPPLGKRWVLNTEFSDEFNGTSLDTAKWLDHHPTWIGREPGLFLPSQVSVKNGYLQIRGEKMDKDTLIHKYNRDLTFNIKGGAVVSKKKAQYGYFESRIKASKTTMSATFWFSSSKSFEGPNGCDKFGQEWDIQECIGREGDFKGKYFASGMHSNAHFWYTDCDGKRHDHRAPQVRFEDEELASENFHVYGGWWRDATQASYYYDQHEPKHQKFYDKVTDKPMEHPMYMRLVVETYPFPWIELPGDEELADPEGNVVYYDWVRSYKLVDAEDANGNASPEAKIGLYYEDVSFENAQVKQCACEELKLQLSYKANEQREIHLSLKNREGKKVAENTVTAYAGYANSVFYFDTEEELEAGIYTLEADIRPVNAERKAFLNASTLRVELTDN